MTRTYKYQVERKAEEMGYTKLQKAFSPRYQCDRWYVETNDFRPVELGDTLADAMERLELMQDYEQQLAEQHKLAEQLS